MRNNFQIQFQFNRAITGNTLSGLSLKGYRLVRFSQLESIVTATN